MKYNKKFHLIILIERQFYDPSHATMDLKMNRCCHTLKTKKPTTKVPQVKYAKLPVTINKPKKRENVLKTFNVRFF
jgi:hypothetical protein